MSGDPFLSRWSRLKREAKDGKPAEAAPAPAPPAAAQPAVTPPAEQPAAPAPPLPPVESLTPESDFSAFMKPQVDALTRRQALKTLFQDPRYNVMDGLDVYIDDYSKADPLPEGWLEKMSQYARLGDHGARLEEEKKAAEAARLESAEPVAGEGAEEPPLDTAAQGKTTPPVGESG